MQITQADEYNAHCRFFISTYNHASGYSVSNRRSLFVIITIMPQTNNNQTKEEIIKAINKLSDELDEQATEFYNDHHLTTDPQEKERLKELSKHYEDLSIKVYKLVNRYEKQ